MPMPLAAERHRLAIHELPKKLDVPRIFCNQKRLEMEIDYLLRDLGRERGIADPHQAVVGQDFNHQPAVKSERLHRSFRQVPASPWDWCRNVAAREPSFRASASREYEFL